MSETKKKSAMHESPKQRRQLEQQGLKQVDDLQISEDLDFQRREWVVQRVGWGVMALLLLGALLGLFGPGPLSYATAGSEGDPLRMEYERFARRHKPSTLKILVGSQAISGNELRLWFSRPYLEALQIERITPEPERVEAGPDRLIYVIPLASGTRQVVVDVHYESDSMGKQPGEVGVEGGPALSFSQFVYP